MLEPNPGKNDWYVQKSEFVIKNFCTKAWNRPALSKVYRTFKLNPWKCVCIAKPEFATWNVQGAAKNGRRTKRLKGTGTVRNIFQMSEPPTRPRRSIRKTGEKGKPANYITGPIARIAQRPAKSIVRTCSSEPNKLWSCVLAIGCRSGGGHLASRSHLSTGLYPSRHI